MVLLEEVVELLLLQAAVAEMAQMAVVTGMEEVEEAQLLEAEMVAMVAAERPESWWLQLISNA
jgi:hypothetical protein